jgi:hypothetical protein
MIKRLILMVSMVGLLALLVAPYDWAQQQIPPAALGPAGDRAARLYNPQAVETLVGQVVAVNRRTPRRPGRPAMVSLVLQTAQGTVKVHLGPAVYLDRQAVKLAAGDQVEVKGVRVNRPRGTWFMAGSVTKGGQVLQLRDETTGRPLWHRSRMRTRAS